jgi:hypothetical protein
MQLTLAEQLREGVRIVSGNPPENTTSIHAYLAGFLSVEVVELVSPDRKVRAAAVKRVHKYIDAGRIHAQLLAAEVAMRKGGLL